MSYYLAIVGTNDSPIYELELGTHRQGGDGSAKFSPEMKELNPFVVHAALDIVEDVQWNTSGLYLKAVDNFYSYMISAFVTPGNVKIMLLHDTKNEDSIRQLFNDVYDLYVKTLLSPFYFVNQPITSPVFDQKVRALARKYL
uniref:ARAD1C03168p n=1 Tax=Blastobotrys adeninivorans TaxID=409370 RepID=A0A060SZ83_BLAAD